MISIEDWEAWIDYLDNFELVDEPAIAIKTTVGEFIAPKSICLATTNGAAQPKKGDVLLKVKNKAIVLDVRELGMWTFLKFNSGLFYNFITA
jgi:hypothetical protein